MSRCVMRQDNYNEFRSRVHAAREGILLNNYIEVTYRCNLGCRQCYNPRAKRFSEELTRDEIIRFIDMFVEAGCLWLSFSGGEPFMREDFLDCYSHAKSRGLLVGILSNGTRIDKKTAKALAEDPPVSIDVTVYGGSPETYDRVTGSPDGFKRCLEGIDNLLEAGVRPVLQTCVSQLNKDDIPVISQLAKERGLKYSYDPHIHPRIDGDVFPVSLRLSPAEVCELMFTDESILKPLKEYLEYYAGNPYCTCEGDPLVQCGMLYEGFWMDPYGRVRMCAIVPEPNYDLRRGGSLKEAWDMFSRYVNAQKVSHDNPCLNCDIAFFCIQCVAWSDLHHKNWNRKVDYLCEIAHREIEEIKRRGLWPEKMRDESLKEVRT